MKVRTTFRVWLCLVLVLALAAAWLPAAAQDEDGSSWLTSSDLGTVGVSSPKAGEVLSGEVDIAGTASSPKFSWYKVEYSLDGQTWITVDENYKHTTAVAQDILATWDTTKVDNGSYWLRAVVVDNTANYLASTPVPVVVANEAAEVVAEEPAVVEEVAPVEEEEAAVAVVDYGPMVPTVGGFVGITSPAAGATLSGEVDISGTASSTELWYYKVEYSLDGSTWISVDEDYEHEDSVTDGILATWDTTAVDNASYWLRAVVVYNTGQFVESQAIQVAVANEAAEVVVEEPAVVEEVAPVEEEEPAVAVIDYGPMVPTVGGFVGITSPAAGATLSGEVDISGTASSTELWYYKVEYSLDGSTWISVDEDYEHEDSVTDGILATWDTTAVDNASYWLRAVVVYNTGQFVESQAIQATVAN